MLCRGRVEGIYYMHTYTGVSQNYGYLFGVPIARGRVFGGLHGAPIIWEAAICIIWVYTLHACFCPYVVHNPGIAFFRKACTW